MRTQKKAISMINLVYLILAAITLIILIMWINNQMQASSYSSSITQCSYFIKNIDGSGAFFTNLKSPNKDLLDSLAKLCPSKSVTINKNQITSASNLIADCYRKAAEGTNFLPTAMDGSGICLYCGSIKANENLNSFSKDLSSDLENNNYKFLFANQQGVLNFNSESLGKSLPQIISKGGEVSIFYYIFKPKTGSTMTEIGNYFTSWFASKGPIQSYLASKLTSSDIQTYSGVIVTDQKEYQQDQILNLDRNGISNKHCAIVVPTKNYN